MPPIREREGFDTSFALLSPYPPPAIPDLVNTYHCTRKPNASSSVSTANLLRCSLSPLTEIADEDQDADGETDDEYVEARKVDGDSETDWPGTRGSIPLTPILEAPLREPFMLRGRKLEPTTAFNVFFWFCAERSGIEMRRRAGFDAP